MIVAHVQRWPERRAARGTAAYDVAAMQYALRLVTDTAASSERR
jgi:hypothetical protein